VICKEQRSVAVFQRNGHVGYHMTRYLIRENTPSNRIKTGDIMSIFYDRRDELEKHEFMMGVARGRLAVTLDVLTDALILIGQHGVYCVSNRNPSKPALDLETVLGEIKGAKELIQSVMEELQREREVVG